MAFNRFAQVQCVALLADLGEVLGCMGISGTSQDFVTSGRCFWDRNPA